MMTRTCVICSADLSAESRVCRRCGSAQAVPSTAEEERAVLHEWRALFNASTLVTDAAPAVDPSVRELFIKNGLLPTGSELLLDEAVYTLKLLGENTSAPELIRPRFEALMTRLELKTLEEPGIARRLSLLRKDAAREAQRASELNRNVLLAICCFLGLVTAAIYFIVRALS